MDRHPARRLAAGALLSALVLLTFPQQTEAEDALSVVKLAAKLYAQDVRGVIGFRTIIESQISAPVFNQKSRTEAFVVQQDGIPRRIVFERLVINGKDASRDELQKQEAKSNASFQDGKGFFKAPYDSRYLDAYRFQLEDCADCSTGMTAIGFSSDVKDDQHGKGVMILDASRRVREVRYTPNVFPPNVTRGTLILKRDEVGKGMLGIRTLKADYHGAMGVIKGSFVMDQRNDDFRRFSSLDEAFSGTGSP